MSLRTKINCICDDIAAIKDQIKDALSADDAKTIAQDCIDEQCKNTFVYSIAADDGPGFTWERWTPGSSTNNSIVGFEAGWGGPLDSNGVPTHTSGAPATLSGIETDTRYSQSEAGQDEHRLCYWVHNDTGQPIEILDTDTRAESIRVYAGCDCPATLVHERYQSEGGPYNSQGAFFTLPDGALTKLTVLIHDPGPDFSGFRLRGQNVGSTTTFDITSYASRPEVECRTECNSNNAPYILADGESFKPLSVDCFECGGGGGDENTDEQQLSISGDTISLTNGGSVTITHPPIPAHPAFNVEYCNDGRERLCYEWYRGFRGQIVNITATDFATDILGWIPEGSYTVPCDGDYDIAFSLPWIRIMNRDCLHQSYWDFRLLVNGTPVQTLTNYTLLENRERQSDEDNNIGYETDDIQVDWCRRLSEGDVISVEWQAKARGIQIVGANYYNRLLVYRSRMTIHGVPTPIVTEVTHP